jgi:transposase
LARKSWKEKVGYHARSLVETTMNQIKHYTSAILTNKREDTRETQSIIKCKIVNMIMAV